MSEEIKEFIEGVKEKISPEIKTPSRLLAAVSYLGVLCFLPYILKRDHPYIGKHAKQGVMLFITEIILFVVWVIPFIGWIVGTIGMLGCFVFSIKGIVLALRGQTWQVPWVGKYIKKFRL